MKAILVDDEPDGIKTLQRMLGLHCPSVNIAATCNSAAAARQQIEALKPDIVFLDIQMPGKSGIEMIGELVNRNFEIIFVTAHNEYMLQALQYSAADYLLKPVDEDRLIEAVERAEKRLQEGKKEELTETLLYNISKAGQPSEMRLCLPTMKGFMILKLDDIVFCEAERSYTVFHLEDRGDKKTVMVSKPLLDYENMLVDTSFFRIHKSFLINLKHVKEYQRGEGGIVIMSNNTEIEVSRRKKEQFLLKIKEIYKY